MLQALWQIFSLIKTQAQRLPLEIRRCLWILGLYVIDFKMIFNDVSDGYCNFVQIVF